MNITQKPHTDREIVQRTQSKYETRLDRRGKGRNRRQVAGEQVETQEGKLMAVDFQNKTGSHLAETDHF